MNASKTPLLTSALALLSIAALAGCGATVTGGDDGWTKEAASEAGGVDEDGADLCALEGWYDDGTCDGFCVEPDGDCSVSSCPDPGAPGVTYVSEDFSACLAAMIFCEEGQVYFGSEDCGCGCVDEVETQACGGIAGLLCGEGEFCDYELDAMCGAADHLGTCQPIPEACPEYYGPVCGCDGVTYDNECFANGAGVAILGDGECGGGGSDPGGAACGGIAGLTCADDEFCDFPDGTVCGGDDSMGVCTPRPQACQENYAPVCACDGTTYPTACAAQAEGVDVFTIGECATTQ